MAAAGKVITGYSEPYFALYAASEGVITYTSGQKMARGVSVEVEIETADDNNYYTDNVLSESAAGLFQSGTLTMEIDGLLPASEDKLFGLPEAGADGWTASGKNQDIPEVGVGFIVRHMSEGITSYTPYIFPRCKFHQPSIEAETQEEDIDWQNTTLEADILAAENANEEWRWRGATVATEADAIAAIKTKFSITP